MLDFAVALSSLAGFIVVVETGRPIGMVFTVLRVLRLLRVLKFVSPKFNDLLLTLYVACPAIMNIILLLVLCK